VLFDERYCILVEGLHVVATACHLALTLVAEVEGHDSDAIFGAVANRRGGRPFMLIAKTTKGKGVSYMENVPIWHYRSPNPDEYRRAIDELETAR